MACTFRDRLLELAEEHEKLQRDHAQLHEDHMRMLQNSNEPMPLNVSDATSPIALQNCDLPGPGASDGRTPNLEKLVRDAEDKQLVPLHLDLWTVEDEDTPLFPAPPCQRERDLMIPSPCKQPQVLNAIQKPAVDQDAEPSTGDDAQRVSKINSTNSVDETVLIACGSGEWEHVRNQSDRLFSGRTLSTEVDASSRPTPGPEKTVRARLEGLGASCESADWLRQAGSAFDLGTGLRSTNFIPKMDRSNPAFQQAFEIATLEALQDCYNAKRDCGVVLPFDRRRTLWDVVLFLCILFELWVTPFDLFFLDAEAMPSALPYVSHVITACFCTDILITFNTGYIEKGEILMTRQMIAKRYFRFWFWLDLVSSLPIDLIFSLMGGGFLRGVKIGKALRIFRTIRYVKMLRSVQLMTTMKKVTWHAKVFSMLQTVLQPIALVCTIIVVGHLHACFWAAVRPHQVITSNMSSALGEYYRCFWQAWIALFLGFSENPSGTDFNPIIIFYVFVSLERVCALAVGGVCVVVYALVYLSDYMKLATMKDNAIKYLQEHEISLETQVQLRFSLEEMAKARFQQHKFAELTCSDHITAELHRRISLELWGLRLMKFGLITQIATMHEDFIMDLCLRVREEVLASRMVLFNYGDSAIAAYHVIRGWLESVKVPGLIDYTIEYEPKHWLGESALVNPSLRRALSVITKAMCYLMVVPAKEFQEVLTNLGLTAKFQKFVRDHLWKGLCSKCGVLGDHFATDCPGVKAHRYTTTNSNGSLDTRGLVSMASYPSSAQMMSHFGSVSRTISRAISMPLSGTSSKLSSDLGNDVVQFLREVDLLKLKPWLLQLHVYTLDDLRELDPADLKDVLGDTLELSDMEWENISPESINCFVKSATNAVQQQFFQADVGRQDYYIFLSHSKSDSGTEAALMRNELEQMLRSDPDSTLNEFDVPIFLDSEDLQSLSQLQEAVRRTHNLVILLSPSVAARGWVLVEIVTAVKLGVRIVPVHVLKPGAQFEFPKEEFYQKFLDGDLLGATEKTVLQDAAVSLDDAANALRVVFQQIAVPYSPHKSSNMRKAELESLLKRCRLNSDSKDAALDKAARSTTSITSSKRSLFRAGFNRLSARMSAIGTRVFG